MTIGNELDALFRRWKKYNENSVDFFTDGVIEEADYQKNGIGFKLLFIGKEPNETNHPNEYFRDFVKEWSSDVKPPEYGFAKRISEWAYGILNDFPPYQDAIDNISYLKRIAFMNLKKSGGGGSTNAGVIEKIVSASEYRKLVMEEIEIINPDIVILGTSRREKIRSLFVDEPYWRESGYLIKVARWGNRRIIDFYHPSSRNVAPASYSLLQNVFHSKVFKSLMDDN